MALAAIRFRGEVRCERRDGQALGLVLQGVEAPRAAGGEAAAIEVVFGQPRVREFVERLEDAVVEELAPRAREEGTGALRRFAVTGAQHRFELEARSVHVHRDVRAAFFAAVPPRPAPLRRRVFFRLVRALVASRCGRRLLRALRGS